MNTHRTKKISGVLRWLLEGYGRGAQGDVARYLNTTASAVSRWAQGTNGATYEHARKLALMFGTTVDELADTGCYDAPMRTYIQFDPQLFCEYALVIAHEIRDVELRADVTRNVRAWLKANAPEFEPIPEPEPTPEPTPAPALTIPQVLREAEILRERYGLEWVVREGGQLGARRTTIEEF